jgi:hypothetical protein
MSTLESLMAEENWLSADDASGAHPPHFPWTLISALWVPVFRQQPLRAGVLCQALGYCTLRASSSRSSRRASCAAASTSPAAPPCLLSWPLSRCAPPRCHIAWNAFVARQTAVYGVCIMPDAQAQCENPGGTGELGGIAAPHFLARDMNPKPCACLNTPHTHTHTSLTPHGLHSWWRFQSQGGVGRGPPSSLVEVPEPGRCGEPPSSLALGPEPSAMPCAEAGVRLCIGPDFGALRRWETL